MKRLVIGICAFAGATLSANLACAYGHANAYGGSTSHNWGSDSTTHTNAYGGSSTHEYGEGTEHTNTYGGNTEHSEYGGTSHTNAYGGTTTGEAGYGAEHTTPYGSTTYASAYHPPTTAYYGSTAYGYHPPTTVNYYGASGCYDCGGYNAAGAAIAGAAVGVAVGATVASANSAAATSNAYAAGYSAGATNSTTTVVVASPHYAVGQLTTVLPTGCITTSGSGSTYYLYGNTWFAPYYGANGVYYQVVPAP